MALDNDIDIDDDNYLTLAVFYYLELRSFRYSLTSQNCPENSLEIITDFREINIFETQKFHANSIFPEKLRFYIGFSDADSVTA